MTEQNSIKEVCKKTSAFLNTITVQAIFCISIAIFLLFLNLFFPKAGQAVLTAYQGYQRSSHDCWNDLTGFWEKAIETISCLKSLEKKDNLAGAGGEPNPFGPYNQIMSPPDNATFSPFVITSTFTIPVEGKLSSPFGYRYHPITGELDFHKGMDISAAYQTPILAMMGGTVITVSENDSAGKYIVLSHTDGFTTTYMHCSAILAKEGMRVKEGEVIAKVGNTGMSTGNHLHIQMEKNHIVLDPSWVIISDTLGRITD